MINFFICFLAFIFVLLSDGPAHEKPVAISVWGVLSLLAGLNWLIRASNRWTVGRKAWWDQ